MTPGIALSPPCMNCIHKGPILPALPDISRALVVLAVEPITVNPGSSTGGVMKDLRPSAKDPDMYTFVACHQCHEASSEAVISFPSRSRGLRKPSPRLRMARMNREGLPILFFAWREDDLCRSRA